MRIGQKIRVGDLKYPGVKFLDPESAVVVAVRVARGAVEDEEEEEEEGAEGAEGAEGDKAAEGEKAEPTAEKSEE